MSATIEISKATLVGTETNRPAHGRRWTRDSVIEAIRFYVSREGHPPAAESWKRAGWWPSYNTVVRHFGSWANAIENAVGRRPNRGVYISRRDIPRGPYRGNLEYAYESPEASMFFQGFVSLDGPMRLHHRVASDDDGWEDRLIARIDAAREIDRWADEIAA